MLTVPRFGRFECHGSVQANTDDIEFISPSGVAWHRPVFQHQPTRIAYDQHGYETITAVGAVVPQARFTPDEVGEWRYAWRSSAAVITEGSFICEESNHPGYVTISSRDPRYFCYTDGLPYVPIGLNLCWPTNYRLSAGYEFQTSAKSGTFGVRDYARWFRRLAESGGNYARLWLGAAYFQAETSVAGTLDLTRFSALDSVVGLAWQYGIRLKLCLEYFRNFTPDYPMSRDLHHPADSSRPLDMDTWFTSADWQSLWMRKVNALLARYGDDPVVMAWELWNEIDCCQGSNWEIVREWTRRTLRTVKAAAPRNLVTNSLGSMDSDAKLRFQSDFHMEEMDFQQVHRYLDPGASNPICRDDTVALSVDAVRRARRPDRPILLAETGATNDNHSGPFSYYRWDDDGLIFHDTTYAALFAGAAGSGHIWHWDEYVDQKNLLPEFAALAAAVSGVEFDRQDFVACDWSTDECWRLALLGQTCALVWLRNKSDRWDLVLRDGLVAPEIQPPPVSLDKFGFDVQSIEIFRPFPDDATGEASVADGLINLPPFRHGAIFRFKP